MASDPENKLIKWSTVDSEQLYQAFLSVSAEHRNMTQSHNIPRLPGSWTESKDYINVHETAIIAPSSSCEVKYRPQHSGICVEIGECSQFFGSIAIQNFGGNVKIGKRTQIGACTLISSIGINIGDDVLCSWDVTFMDSDNHGLDFYSRRNDVLMCGLNYLINPTDIAKNRDWSDAQSAPIVIGNKVWIGFGVTILKGVTIGEGAIIGSKSVITKNVPAYTVVAGNPARIIKEAPRL